MTHEEIVKRGEYLVNLGGCNDCHSPKRMTEQGPVPDQSILLSGHPANMPTPAIPAGLPDMNSWVGLCNVHMTTWVGPWGVSYTANLTPDPQTGLGMWTEQNFIDAMHTGRHMGHPDGRMILPPMPWQEIGMCTDDDLKAIFAYLQSLPAVPNLVPAPEPPVAQAAPSGTQSN